MYTTYIICIYFYLNHGSTDCPCFFLSGLQVFTTLYQLILMHKRTNSQNCEFFVLHLSICFLICLFFLKFAEFNLKAPPFSKTLQYSRISISRAPPPFRSIFNRDCRNSSRGNVDLKIYTNHKYLKYVSEFVITSWETGNNFFPVLLQSSLRIFFSPIFFFFLLFGQGSCAKKYFCSHKSSLNCFDYSRGKG